MEELSYNEGHLIFGPYDIYEPIILQHRRSNFNNGGYRNSLNLNLCCEEEINTTKRKPKVKFTSWLVFYIIVEFFCFAHTILCHHIKSQLKLTHFNLLYVGMCNHIHFNLL